MTYNFERTLDGGMIIVSLTLDYRNKFRMILDTGCSNTTIDSNALYLSGYELKDSVETVEIETANGIVTSEVFEINHIRSLGIAKEKFKIQVYDFLAHGIFSNYDGLIGLDFLEGMKFCIDTKLNKITIDGKSPQRHEVNKIRRGLDLFAIISFSLFFSANLPISASLL